MPSVANTRFSRKFRNHLTINALSFQRLIQHPKSHLPHCETWSFALRNMPNPTTKHARSRRERWPIATRKMPNGKWGSRFFVAHLVKSAFLRAISRKIIHQLFHQKVGQTATRFATVSPPVAHAPTLHTQPITANQRSMSPRTILTPDGVPGANRSLLLFSYFLSRQMFLYLASDGATTNFSYFRIFSNCVSQIRSNW